MGFYSRSHICQGAEKTHDRKVSSADEMIKGGPDWGHRDFQAGLMSECSLCFPSAALLCYHSEITKKMLTQIN